MGKSKLICGFCGRQESKDVMIARSGIEGVGIVDFEIEPGSLGPDGWYEKNMRNGENAVSRGRNAG